MTWAKLDDRANEHRKQLAAGAEACWLWACGLMYANRQPARDGFIPEQMLPMLYPMAPGKRTKLCARLVEVGLWTNAPGGYQIHEFRFWNRTKEQVEAEREATRLRVAEHRRNKAEAEQCNGCGNGVTPDDVTQPGNGGGNANVPDPLRSAAAPTPTDPPVAPQGATKPKRGRGSGGWRRIPADWQPRPEELAWAWAHWVDAESELAKMRDHEYSKPRTDPDAACRTWFRNAWEYKGSPKPRTGAPAKAPTDLSAEKARLEAEFDARRKADLAAEAAKVANASHAPTPSEVRALTGGLFNG